MYHDTKRQLSEYKTKAQRRQWFEQLSEHEKAQKVSEWQEKKAQRRKAEMFAGTDNYSCQTCYHNETNNCMDVEPQKCCSYWYAPDSEIVGLAYDHKETDNMPLFA